MHFLFNSIEPYFFLKECVFVILNIGYCWLALKASNNTSSQLLYTLHEASCCFVEWILMLKNWLVTKGHFDKFLVTNFIVIICWLHLFWPPSKQFLQFFCGFRLVLKILASCRWLRFLSLLKLGFILSFLFEDRFFVCRLDFIWGFCRLWQM